MRRLVVLLLLATLAVAACDSSTPSSGVGTPGASAPASTDGGGLSPSDSAAPSSVEPPASSAPAETPGTSPVDQPTPEPSGSTPTASDAPTASASAAALPCQPEGNNPNFWPGIAHSVSWEVYCAVLPKGWYVSSGSYRLANGGKLLISYKGPGGASLSLSEGSFCTDGSGCVPSGSAVGDAAFGGLGGTLIAVDSGGFAIVVDRGQTPSWLMTTSGLDQATTVSLGAALAHISG